MPKIYTCLQNPSTARRNREVGKLGERWAEQALAASGFTNIIDLNKTRTNHKYADVYAERAGERYVISVKCRNKNYANGKLNSAYNLSARGQHLALAEKAEQTHTAKAAWVAISFVEKSFSAYFGLLQDLQGKNKIPMTPFAIKSYECLASDELHHIAYSDVKNVYEIVGTASETV